MILVDTHTHTLASKHAYSTIGEMVRQAALIGLEGIAITDHGPLLGDAPDGWYFGRLRSTVPQIMEGVRVLCGAEVNIMDFEGGIDLDERIIKTLDIIIASMHAPCLRPGSRSEHTRAWKRVAENPLVDVMGHMGNAQYPFDYEQVLACVKKHDKLVEINNHSFHVRPGSRENCLEIARLCARMEIGVVLSTDAHIAHDVGRVDISMEIAETAGIPQELIMNTSLEKLLKHLNVRRSS